MTIFSKIIAGEIPGYKISENEKFYAFLDIFPLREGHVLVVPKIEIDRFFDVPDDYLSEMLVFSKPIARAIEKSFSCNRCGRTFPEPEPLLFSFNSPVGACPACQGFGRIIGIDFLDDTRGRWKRRS